MSGADDKVNEGALDAPEESDMVMREPEGAAPASGEKPLHPIVKSYSADPSVLYSEATVTLAADEESDIAWQGVKRGLRDAGAAADDVKALDKARAAARRQRADAAANKPGPRAVRLEFQRGDHPELGARMLRDLGSDARPVFDLGATHVYRHTSGVWSPVDRSGESCAIQRYAGATVRSQEGAAAPLRLRASDVKGTIELAHDQATRRDGVGKRIPFFDAAPAGLAFRNGFVRIVDGKLSVMPHHPDNRARFAYAFDFDPDAPCPRWKAFLSSVFRDDDDAAEKVALLQEYGGACMVGIAASYHKAVIQRGEGRNGKNVAGLVISGAMPPGSVCSVEPQKWGEDYFRAAMVGALLNFVAELPESDIIKADHVKSIIDGSPQNARHPAEKVIPFLPRFGNIWNANGLPATADHSHAFWDRFVLVEYNRIFGPEERIPDLEKLILAEELPGLVAFFLAGAERVTKQGRYTEVPSSAAAMATWRRDADPVALFLEARTRRAEHYRERETCEAVYERFKAWCGTNGHKPMSSTKFGTRMRMLGKESEAGHDKARVYPVTFLPSADDGFMLQKMGVEPDPDDVARAAMAEASVCPLCSKVRGLGGCRPCGVCGNCTAMGPTVPGACTC